VGLTGGDGDASIAAGGTLVDTTYTATGNTAVPAFSGLSLVSEKDAPNNSKGQGGGRRTSPAPSRFGEPFPAGAHLSMYREV
jgi:hypothetical protein